MRPIHFDVYINVIILRILRIIVLNCIFVAQQQYWFTTSLMYVCTYTEDKYALKIETISM